MIKRQEILETMLSELHLKKYGFKTEIILDSMRIYRVLDYGKERFSFTIFRAKDLSHIIGAVKEFDAIEDLIDKHKKLHDIPNTRGTISKKSSPMHNVSDIKVETQEDVKKVASFYKKAVYNEFLPFFEKWQTIEQLYEHTESLSFLGVEGFLKPEAKVRRLVLKALVKAPDFQEYGEFLIPWMEEAADETEQANYIRVTKYLPGLFEELKAVYKDPTRKVGQVQYKIGPYKYNPEAEN